MAITEKPFHGFNIYFRYVHRHKRSTDAKRSTLLGGEQCARDLAGAEMSNLVAAEKTV